MVYPKFFGEVKDGILRIKRGEAYKHYLHTINGAVELIVKPRRKIRTLNQNSYYWGVIIELLRMDLGYTPDEMHEALKWKFLRKGDTLPTVRSTATLNTKEFGRYLDDIVAWAGTEMGVYIPTPDEYYEENPHEITDAVIKRPDDEEVHLSRMP